MFFLAGVRTHTAGQRIRGPQTPIQHPNIMGVITCQEGSAASGAIEIINATGGTVVTGNLRNVKPNRLNASLYSSIYSGSSTVQPPSLRLLPCIKT